MLRCILVLWASWRKMQDRMKPFGGVRTMETKHSIRLEVLEERKPTKFQLFSCWMVKFGKLSFLASCCFGAWESSPLMCGISSCFPVPHFMEKPNFLIPLGSGMMSRERIWGPGPDPAPFTLHPRRFPTLKSLSIPLRSTSGWNKFGFNFPVGCSWSHSALAGGKPGFIEKSNGATWSVIYCTVHSSDLIIYFY